ncbi:MAG: hypothetical protein ACWGO1_13395 [Anaerolineales bacterium]
MSIGMESHAEPNWRSDLSFLSKLRFWIVLEGLLFLVFLALAYTLTVGFLTLFGVAYLLSLGLAIGIVIRMRATIESPIKSRYQVAAA